MANSKVADLAGPGFGNYTQLESVLPNDYSSALTGGRRPFGSTSATIKTNTP